MKKVFEFTNRQDFYDKCLYASVAHAIMVGEYSLLTDEIGWDSDNYLFQNMQGTRGVFSFTEDSFVCAIQNEANGFQNGMEKFDQNNKELVKFVESEVLPYLLVERENGDIKPFITSAFWGNEDIVSLASENEIMADSEGTLLPYVYEIDDVKRYWCDYYEMDDRQVKLVEELFNERRNNASVVISDEIISELKK